MYSKVLAAAAVALALPVASHAATITISDLTGPDADIDKVANAYGRRRVEDADGKTLIIFDNEWTLPRSVEQEKELTFHDVQPRGP